MSKRRGAFDETATNVTVLPDPPTVSFPRRKDQLSQGPVAAQSIDPADNDATPDDQRPRSTQATTRASRTQSAARRARTNRYPDAAIAPDLAQRVRELAIAEKAVDPINCRSHGTIILQAIEAHAEAIQDAFRPQVPTTSTGLFNYTDTSVTRQRRRHGQVKPVKIVLSGVLKSDARKLDELVKVWGTGNRSALVETALRLYFDQLDAKN